MCVCTVQLSSLECLSGHLFVSVRPVVRGSYKVIQICRRSEFLPRREMCLRRSVPRLEKCAA